MAMHCYHGGLPGYDPEAILHDGCEECEERASAGVSGMLALDQTNLDLLWRRCLNSEYSQGGGGEEAGEYRSNCEARLGHQLYLFGVLSERSEREAAWHPERFAGRNHV
jgi:hypothetical protein